MRERFFKVQRAINILQEHMAYFVCDELKDYYGEDDWWYEVCNVLKFPDKLPNSGSYEMLVGSLEISQLLQLLDRCWNDVFGTILDKECRAWVNELKGVRNLTSHSGINDLDQLVAERHLDTMARLCEFFSAGGAEDIWKLHTEVREMDIKTEIVEVVPEEQDTDIPRDIEIAPTKKEEVNVSKDEDINLISLIGTEAVQKTTLTRKVTFGGKTLAYPVYRVRLDLLKYNDQNDRIATWMSRYAAENGSNVLESKKREDFNIIIEDFV